ncbi:unnamed protein product [Rhizoctonia solani]|uniref:Polysaccharide lyase family 8 central domain-containing protein n=1 Tax=Rhizoctonia solani TaxID=456999 RepID=A0A8H3BDI0_9AGAM|nr:unnamed protein product [Rhizoctonia solani]
MLGLPRRTVTLTVLLTLVSHATLASADELETLYDRRDLLTEFELELGNRSLITSRAFAPHYREMYPGYLGGANGIGIAVIGIDAGLSENNKTGNVSKIVDAYERVHNQHNGIIFDGNYGKDFINSLLDLELLALNTQFPANQTTKDIFGFHLDGSRRMTFTNTLSKVIRWDFVVSLADSYPIRLQTLAAPLPDLIEVGTVLAEAANDRSVIAAKLTGGRVFWSSDYMIHRTNRTVTTVKMLSNRTSTSKCTNSEGPYNFHLSDEAVYTYTTGAEYEDMFAALDYNIIPGIITDYNGTVLDCGTVAADGIDTYAGGVEADDIGMAAM